MLVLRKLNNMTKPATLLLLIPLSLSAVIVKADTNSNKRILDQAAIVAQAIKAERYDIAATLSPPSMVGTLGGVAVYEKKIREELAGFSILECKPDAVLSTATLDGEMFATVSTTIIFNLDNETARINSYLIALSNDGGCKWCFINGSERMRTYIQTYSAEVAQQLTFPDVTMKFDTLSFEKRGEEWVLDKKSLENMKRLLENANRNKR